MRGTKKKKYSPIYVFFPHKIIGSRSRSPVSSPQKWPLVFVAPSSSTPELTITATTIFTTSPTSNPVKIQSLPQNPLALSPSPPISTPPISSPLYSQPPTLPQPHPCKILSQQAAFSPMKTSTSSSSSRTTRISKNWSLGRSWLP